jgi:spermidine dehydrogenase
MKITRRDFLNGVAFGAGLLARPPRLWAAPSESDHYPPALTGMRGNHDGAFETMHAVKDGEFWEKAGAPADTGEVYDLVIVGAGVSGLAAARFWQDAMGPKARILLLDNHDDFGGHARRNELTSGKRTLISYAGSYAIDSPAPYSAVAQGLIQQLGIDVPRGGKVLDRKLYASLGLQRGVWFDKDTFGADRTVPDPLGDFGGEADDEPPAGRNPWPRFLAEAPWPQEARDQFQLLCKGPPDWLPGLSDAEKKAKLARMSYAELLTKHAKVHDLVFKFLQSRTHALYGAGIDAVAAQDAWGLGMPGFDGMKLDPTPGPGMDKDALTDHKGERYFFHFPDGNASIARLLVRALIPEAVPGKSADDVVMARTRYALLDRPGQAVRLRLSSTVVRVQHRGDPAKATEVEVAYVRDKKLQAVRAARVVMACWHPVIPHLMPDLPDAQREAMAYGVKVPIIYTNVLIRNWTAFHKLGFGAVHAPGGWHSTVNLGRAASIADYRSPASPDEPMILHLVRTPCHPGLPIRQQYKMGRLELLQTPFAVFEQKIRDQLGRMLSPGGFDPSKDIEGITVNRWSHGYAYQYSSLWDPFMLEGGKEPCITARQPFGLVAMANSDAGAYAYLDSAIDQAHRAIQELRAIKR